MTTLTYHLAHAVMSGAERGRHNVVLSRLEHDANAGPWVRLAEDAGCEVRWIDVTPYTFERARRLQFLLRALRRWDFAKRLTRFATFPMQDFARLASFLEHDNRIARVC